MSSPMTMFEETLASEDAVISAYGRAWLTRSIAEHIDHPWNPELTDGLLRIISEVSEPPDSVMRAARDSGWIIADCNIPTKDTPRDQREAWHEQARTYPWATGAAPTLHRYSFGTLVNRDVADEHYRLLRAAAHYGISLLALSSADRRTVDALISQNALRRHPDLVAELTGWPLEDTEWVLEHASAW